MSPVDPDPGSPAVPRGQGGRTRMPEGKIAEIEDQALVSTTQIRIQISLDGYLVASLLFQANDDAIAETGWGLIGLFQGSMKPEHMVPPGWETKVVLLLTSKNQTC